MEIIKYENLKTPRFFSCNQCAKIGDFVYVFGGMNSKGDLFDIEKIDLIKKTTEVIEQTWKTKMHFALTKYPIIYEANS